MKIFQIIGFALFVGWKSDFILLKDDIIANESEIVSINYLTNDVIELKIDTKKIWIIQADNLWILLLVILNEIFLDHIL